MKYNLLLFVLCSLGFSAHAQEKYSLEDCINIAMQNDYDLKNKNSEIQISERVYRQSKSEKYPSLTTGFSQGLHLGRNIDPYSNHFVDQTFNSARLALSSEFTLFDGKVTKNTSRLKRENKAINELELESLSLELKKIVTLAYLELILKQQTLALKYEQKDILQIQLDRIALLDSTQAELDSISTDVIAQLENEKYYIVQEKAGLTVARNRLLALMNLRTDTEIDVEEPLVPNLLSSGIDNRQDHILKLSYLRQKELEIQRSNLNLLIKKGAKKPYLSLNGGLNSIYSSLVNTKINTLDGEPLEFLQESRSEFVQIDGQNIPLNRLVIQPKTEEVKFGYFSQLFSNSGLSFALNFSYPIYDKQSRNTEIQVAKIEKIMAQNDLMRTQSEVQAELTEIKSSIYSSEDQYLQALKQEETQSKAFDLSLRRFEKGLISFSEFNQAKINLERAKSNILQNRYTRYFYNLIYRYYTGK
ncbi:TolC family protein [uncultured Arcticibacterium sp.]|uniref:TolC family protein n=1 Tax=uncultured Arcticibacterium sp. TaxID=2173042 RepID=UPI0030FB8DED